VCVYKLWGGLAGCLQRWVGQGVLSSWLIRMKLVGGLSRIGPFKTQHQKAMHRQSSTAPTPHHTRRKRIPPHLRRPRQLPLRRRQLPVLRPQLVGHRLGLVREPRVVLLGHAQVGLEARDLLAEGGALGAELGYLWGWGVGGGGVCFLGGGGVGVALEHPLAARAHNQATQRSLLISSKPPPHPPCTLSLRRST